MPSATQPDESGANQKKIVSGIGVVAGRGAERKVVEKKAGKSIYIQMTFFNCPLLNCRQADNLMSYLAQLALNAFLMPI
jgi:hypothetical protein